MRLTPTHVMSRSGPFVLIAFGLVACNRHPQAQAATSARPDASVLGKECDRQLVGLVRQVDCFRTVATGCQLTRPVLVRYEDPVQPGSNCLLGTWFTDGGEPHAETELVATSHRFDGGLLVSIVAAPRDAGNTVLFCGFCEVGFTRASDGGLPLLSDAELAAGRAELSASGTRIW